MYKCKMAIRKKDNKKRKNFIIKGNIFMSKVKFILKKKLKINIFVGLLRN